MSKEEILSLIAQSEGQRLEFKKSVAELDRVIQTLTAFANTNTDGGCVFIGVGDKGKIKEVVIGRETTKQIADKISAHTDPVLYPEIEVVKGSGDKGIIVITIDGSPNKPHLAFGRAYKRVGSTTTQMTRDEYERLLFEKERVSFDNKTTEGVNLDDIDPEKVTWFLDKARRERNLHIDPNIPLLEALKKLDLIRNNKPANAAVLMFGKEPQKLFLQAEVRGGRFKGAKVTDGFIDMKVIEGTAYEQVDEVEKFVLRNICKAAWIAPGQIEREEKWEYPPDAIREAITNAVVHRDYFSTANVQVRIFDDRIEVWSPGYLPEGLTIEDLKGIHESKPRNILLAKLFFLIKYIEQWGTGTNKIIEESLKHGLPEPEFKEIAGSFVVIFRKAKLTEEFLGELHLNERQRNAVEYLKKHRRITSKEYAELFRIPTRTARYDIKELVDKGILTQKGESKKTTYYELTAI